jgi:DNA-binding MarR family transcriptional regulator
VGSGSAGQVGVKDGYLRGALSRPATQRQMDVLAAFVVAGGSVPNAAELVGIRPSTVKRHLADLRARSGLTTEQLIYAGRAAGWLVIPNLEPQ